MRYKAQLMEYLDPLLYISSFLTFLLQLEESYKSNSYYCDRWVLAKPLDCKRHVFSFLSHWKRLVACITTIMWNITFVLISNFATKVMVICLLNHFSYVPLLWCKRHFTTNATQFWGISLIWNQKIIQFTRDIYDKCDLWICCLWTVMQKSTSATIHEFSLHTCILSTSKRKISANKNKAFHFMTLDIIKGMYLNV